MYSFNLSLTSALVGMGGQHHAPAALPPGTRPCTHCVGGWVGPRAGLDGCRKSCPHRDACVCVCRHTHKVLYTENAVSSQSWRLFRLQGVIIEL